MMKSCDTARYDEAAQLLPFALRTAAEAVPFSVKALAEEFRLRVGKTITVLLPDGEKPVPGLPPLTPSDLISVMEIATRASVHSSMDSIREGYISTRGGFRVGICGSAAMDRGEIAAFRTMSSLAIRISRQIKGIAEKLLPEIAENGRLLSTLIISPPGAGKTTLLRDLVRCASDGEGIPALRVSVADERGEIAAMSGGTARLDVGKCTDVLDGAPKAKAVMLLLRAMNPEVIAMDEISAPEDIAAIRIAANCGVSLLATAHAESREDMLRRELYRQLEGIFSRVVTIKNSGGRRSYEVERC